MKPPSEEGSRTSETTASTSTRKSPSANAFGIVAVIVGLVALYLVFVLRYSVNSLFWDDWSVVPLINAAQHGHLTFSMLWRQHN
ncbi:MAG: hypothetical protein ACRD6W_14155, partial [Nitrososphaerales archaeon]